MQIITKKGWTCLGVLLAVGAVVVPAKAEEQQTPTNAVQMVTYFPVPYARYNNLYIGNSSGSGLRSKLDIGTVSANSFSLSTGSTDTACSTSSDYSFVAGNVNLRTALIMAQDFQTTTATFGKTDQTEIPDLQFNDLYFQGQNNQTFNTIKAGVLNISSPSDIYMLKGYLPSSGCPSGSVRWESLQFQEGGRKNYLVCCENQDTCHTCEAYSTQQQTCLGNNPNNNPAIEGQVQGTWIAGSGIESCQCDCTNAEYTADITGQLLIGAERKIALNYNENDYDYCQQKCWDQTEDSDGPNTSLVYQCIHSTWPDPTQLDSEGNPQQIPIGASWNYDDCTCQCNHTSANFVNNGDYWCKHKCQASYNNGKVALCKANKDAYGWEWVDGRKSGKDCYCNCGNYNIYKQSANHVDCEHRCVAGNPIYNSAVQACNSTKGNGSGWHEGAWGSSGSCTCDCGTKTQGGVTKPREWDSNSLKCKDPSF